MPTYIVVGNYTQKGIENVKDSPDRLAAARELATSLGAEIKDFYYTLGRYDFVLTIDAPSDEVTMKILLITGSKGSVRTETLVALPAEKGVELIKGLP